MIVMIKIDDTAGSEKNSRVYTLVNCLVRYFISNIYSLVIFTIKIVHVPKKETHIHLLFDSTLKMIYIFW